MSFYARDQSIVVLKPGTFRTEIGTADYLQLPTMSVKTKPQKEELWLHLFKKHGVHIELNDFPTLLLVPSYYSQQQIEADVQLLFEKINCPGLYLLDQSVATVYGCGYMTGLVIDIGHTYTTIVAVIESMMIQTSKTVLEIGGKEVQEHGLDCLFNPKLAGLQIMGLAEAVCLTVKNSCEVSKRTQLFENIILSGGVSEDLKLHSLVEKRLLEYAAGDTGNEYQFKEVKFLHCPEYMTLYKKRPSEVCFLGGAIVGKLVFGSGGYGYISKQDYNEHGPRVYEKYI